MLETYLKIFDITLEEFSILGFSDEKKIALITKIDGSMVKYDMSKEIRAWEIVRGYIPKELSFVGFQHSEEGVSFMAFAKMEIN